MSVWMSPLTHVGSSATAPLVVHSTPPVQGVKLAALLPEVKNHPALSLLSEPRDMQFDAEGNLL